MPYIAIKAYPKDEAVKKELVEKINQVVMDVCNVPQKAVTISVEEIAKEDWPEKVLKAEIEPKSDKLWIKQGEKLYE